MINSQSADGQLQSPNSGSKSLTERAIGYPNIQVADREAEFFDEEKEGLDLLHLWHIVLKRKWTVVTFFLIVAIAGTIASFLETPIYRASLTVNIERETPRIVDYQNAGQVDTYRDFYYFKTQEQLLKSRRLAEKVSEKLALENLAATNDAPPLKQWLSQWLTQLGIKEPVPQTPTIVATSTVDAGMLLGGITVAQIENSSIYRISYDSPNPDLAARVVNTWADAFIEANIERRVDASSYARDFLTDRLQQFKEKLEESENRLLDFARQHEIVSLDEKQTITTQKLQDINSAFNAAEQERIKAESISLQLKGDSAQGLSQILENPVVQQLKQTKAQLESEYQENLKIFKPAYPKMIQLQSQINQIQAKIDEEVGNVRASIKASYDAAKSQEKLLGTRLEEIKGEVSILQSRSIEYNILKREVDTNRQLYEDILQRLKEVGVASAVDTNNISIVDRAQKPSSPYTPNHRKNILLAMMLGLFGGIALAFLFEYLDDTIKYPEDVERQLGIPVLGVIPTEVKEQSRDEPNTALALLAQEQPRSAFAEAYRSTRTALQFSTSEGTPRVLLVTSAIAGEGKSTTALSLAIQFAQAGKKVLLIDADLRNPSLHRGLKLDNSEGLTHYLAGPARPADIAKPTTIANLFCIPTGPLPPNPAELLSSAKMVSLLSLAAEKFGQVIVDSPPVLGLADALILGNLAGGALITVEAGNTRRGYIQNALKRLKQSRTHLLGGVLTKLDIQRNAYGYYYQSYYYYYGERSTVKERLV
jgi:succinoglycan biosynthesis transport protein ExoP